MSDKNFVLAGCAGRDRHPLLTFWVVLQLNKQVLLMAGWGLWRQPAAQPLLLKLAAIVQLSGLLVLAAKQVLEGDCAACSLPSFAEPLRLSCRITLSLHSALLLCAGVHLRTARAG